MKFNYRGQLKNGKMVDVVDFDFTKEIALCDNNDKIHIDEFETIFVPIDTFKQKFIIKKKTTKKKQQGDSNK